MSATKTVVLTGVGKDRVGIVAELTHVLFELGCNLHDSSMTLLAGQFALIVIVELPPTTSVEQLERSLGRMQEQLGMQVHVRELSGAEIQEQASAEDCAEFIVSVYGADRPGIVSTVTKALADEGLNITDVQTKRTGGSPKIFVMILELTAHHSVSAAHVEQRLKKIASELAIDISVQALDVVEL